MNNSLALREVVLADIGIMLTPRFIVDADLRAGRLIALLNAYQARELSIYAVYPERRHLSPKVRSFIEFVAERLAHELR